MKVSRKVKQFLSCFLISLSIGQFPITVLAAQPESELLKQDNIQVEMVDENTLNVENSDSTDTITVNETDEVREIAITNSTTGKNDYIIYNKVNNTVYSSMVDKTINLNENPELSPDSSAKSTRTARSVSSYQTKYISYAQIKSIVGSGATAAGVIGAILYFVPGAQGIGGAMGAISTIVGGINSGVRASSKHGIKLKIKVTKYYRTRLGRKNVYRINRSISSYQFY